MALASSTMPLKAQVLVIGGGPSGSYSATLLAREGFDVALLESDIFPRYHIGESLLPSIHQFLALIDANDLLSSHGFTPKPGAAVKLNQFSREGYTDFTSLDSNNKAWNVIRAEFDDILLKNAANNGVKVFQGVKVVNIVFSDQNPERPVAAEWVSKAGAKGSVSFEWLVDASGRAGIMSTKHLKNRTFNQSLRNVACWGYWRGGKVYSPGTTRENAPWFEALTDETGWSWYIPLHDGTVSVGFVTTEESSVAKKAATRRGSDGQPVVDAVLKIHYLDQLQFTPGLASLLETAQLSSDVKSARDYSYKATAVAGDHFRIVGDAGAFIDPFFSSGVHLAFTSALSSACTIAASIRGHCSEREAQTYHELKVGTSYTRFLIVVLGAYKQIKAQHAPVLQDLNEGNFDRAFALLRPVLQGAGDVGKELTEDEVQRAMEFCSNLFAPTDPKMHSAVAARVDRRLMDKEGPILLSEEVKKIVGEEDEEAIHVLNEINARKPIHTMYDVAQQFGHEAWGGFVPVCVRGKLGLDGVVVDDSEK
ncbi:putative halogenase [Heterobasidion irregulare TC 32-1]|uniref:Putative halogenase n=1 Tax=Heterobasidion irregulare (strain TC 32-1) TaxID=747525 RepID=W4K2G9_HETIT|nr:putative halogenase [Heterobasidion irregulare TC 32-1]ETW79545.1 putative halogenase [Heterobasidion irregulare TC 32-1]